MHKDKGVDVECLSDPDRVTHFLDAIDAAHQQWLSVNVRPEKNTSGYYETLAKRLDSVFAVSYLITAVGFLAYIFIKMKEL